MLIKKSRDTPSSEITPQSLYLNRRKFLIGAAAAAGSAALSTRLMAEWFRETPVLGAGTQLGNLAKSAYSATEPSTPRQLVTTFNNFYEFGSNKGDPSQKRWELSSGPLVRFG